MSLIKRLFGGQDATAKPRTRVCVECGMPVAEHKEWCSILRGHHAMKGATTAPRSEEPA